MNKSVVTRSGEGGVVTKKWERVKGFTISSVGDGQARLRWKFSFDPKGTSETAHFAFCYPYPMMDVNAKTAAYEQQYGLPFDLTPLLCRTSAVGLNQSSEHLASEGTLPPSPPSTSKDEDPHEVIAMQKPQQIYFRRELLCHSLGGLGMELLTITSHEGLLPGEREDYLPLLFPDRTQRRPHKFHDSKKVIFVSSRVHPGETPAQFVYDGFLDFIFRQDDPRAVSLRKQFIFKLIPILNPDGVYRGYYRLDTLGQNLNRHYVDPDFEKQPTIYASKAIVLDLFNRGIMYFYLDLHAHASKKGCFIYGNQLESLDDQVTNKLFPLLVGMNSPFFEYGACNFTEKNMKMKDKRDRGGASKEGSGRVAIYRQTGLLHSYVLECNYNKGKETSVVPPASRDNGRASPGTVKGALPTVPIYVSEDWENVGKGCAIAILDMNGQNPWSRLLRSQWNNLEGAKQYVKRDVRSQPAYREESINQRRSGSVVASLRGKNRLKSKKEEQIENYVVSVSGRPPPNQQERQQQQHQQVLEIQQQLNDSESEPRGDMASSGDVKGEDTQNSEEQPLRVALPDALGASIAATTSGMKRSDHDISFRYQYQFTVFLQNRFALSQS